IRDFHVTGVQTCALPILITSNSDLICFWDFQESPGEERVAKGPHRYRLQEMAGPVQRVEDGVFGPYSARLEEGQWFCAPRQSCRSEERRVGKEGGYRGAR